MDAKRIKTMADKIYKAKKMYYTTSSPIMSDVEYDALERNLSMFCPKHPILKMVGYDINNNYKNLSLKQTEDLLNESKS